MKVIYTPVPWPSSKVFYRSDIVQIFAEVQSYMTRTKYDLSDASLRTVPGFYRLKVITRDGYRTVLAKYLLSRNEAKTIERILEQRLGIENRAVDGELE